MFVPEIQPSSLDAVIARNVGSRPYVNFK